VRIVVGITGGIAAYKAISLVRLLVQAGHDVKVIPTQNALRFVGSTTLEAISSNTVDPDLYTDVADVKHVELGQSADLIIVAPATASFIARTAAGIADDLLSNVILASRAPKVIAPAMHTEMWENAATRRNIDTLLNDGFVIVEPEIGQLTGGDVGKGRMAEPETIVGVALATASVKDLMGKRILISAGGTREPIDPVRFIGNNSSGKQGLALARAAARRGADVTLVLANVFATETFKVVRADTAADMLLALSARASATDALIMTAAISDYRVVQPSPAKMKKASAGDTFELTLIQNEDILTKLAPAVHEANPNALVVGFAAETESDEQSLELAAKKKLISKGCDLIVANDVSDGQVFDKDTNSVRIVSSEAPTVSVSGSKVAVADAILDAMLMRWHDQ